MAPRSPIGWPRMSSFVSLQAPPRPALSGDEPQTRLIDWWPAALVVLISVVLCLPFLRTILSMGDEGVLLHGGAFLQCPSNRPKTSANLAEPESVHTHNEATTDCRNTTVTAS